MLHYFISNYAEILHKLNYVVFFVLGFFWGGGLIKKITHN